ncbi:MAG: hypothetical protein H6936_02320 [Burkholderiales bacterium]|nr:hypothetical protein [Nitrosomonas sp.]MCP5273690.1 hypothetical protein [Burkholderiales bacterium]
MFHEIKVRVKAHIGIIVHYTEQIIIVINPGIITRLCQTVIAITRTIVGQEDLIAFCAIVVFDDSIARIP